MELVRQLLADDPYRHLSAYYARPLLTSNVLLAVLTLALLPPASAQDAVEPPSAEPTELALPLLERDPFDRITLDAENKNSVIETVLLDLPERRVPDPLPQEGSLKLRRLSHPSIPYEVSWSAIEKIELFEFMLLAEAERLTAAGEYAAAFDYYSSLSANYPQLPGLEAALQNHLWREVSAAFAANKAEEAWPVLHALYLRNPQYPRLLNALQAVSDHLIAARLERRDYQAARAVVDTLEQSFPKVPLENVARWRAKFQANAQEQMTAARAALAEERYNEARDAVTLARSILPSVEGGEALWKQIQSAAPEIRVGVMQAATPADPGQTATWPTARVSQLVNPPLVAMVGFGAEGGLYESAWGEISTSDDGLATTLRLSTAAMSRGLTPDAIALQLAEMAKSSGGASQVDFAAMVKNIRIEDGQAVAVTWRRPPLRPEAFLQAPLKFLTTSERSPGLWFDLIESDHPTQQRFQRTGAKNTAAADEPRFIVEQVFEVDDQAVEALIVGDIDVVDRIYPWQAARIEETAGITLGAYRMPTIHVLIPNFKNPLLETREFRRALCYGIDSESIVRDILLGGEVRPGFRTLSGPFAAGVSLSDPVGYAYDSDVAPRPYEPRLAALLSGVARQTLAKREAEAKKKQRDANKPAEKSAPSAESPKADADAESNEEPAEEDAPPAAPLVLAHSGDAMARLACQTIKIQLDGVGIPIKLVEFAGSAPPADAKYDLLYAELTLWEPLFDTRGLLGQGGLAGRTSPLIGLALDQLAQAENWNQARAQLNEIYRMAHYDLPVLPLWQTVNHFAYRDSVSGVGADPVTLYQNLSAWRKSFE